MHKAVHIPCQPVWLVQPTGIHVLRTWLACRRTALRLFGGGMHQDGESEGQPAASLVISTYPQIAQIYAD
jgi:hypothetical protein